MHTLYSMDEHRKMHQKNIEKEIEGYRLSKLVKESQSYRPMITRRIFVYVQAFLGNFVSRLRCVIAQQAQAYFSNSNAEIKPC